MNPFGRLTFTSKYSQKMRQISCKIFNEFYVPEITRKEFYEPNRIPVIKWLGRWQSEEATLRRTTAKPMDLEPSRNWNYYPAHPQIRQFTHVLRQYGLFRDEHRDYNEEMKRIRILKGKKEHQRVFGSRPKKGSKAK